MEMKTAPAIKLPGRYPIIGYFFWKDMQSVH